MEFTKNHTDKGTWCQWWDPFSAAPHPATGTCWGPPASQPPRRGLGSPGGQGIGHDPAVHPCGKESQRHPGLQQEVGAWLSPAGRWGELGESWGSSAWRREGAVAPCQRVGITDGRQEGEGTGLFPVVPADRMGGNSRNRSTGYSLLT